MSHRLSHNHLRSKLKSSATRNRRNPVKLLTVLNTCEWADLATFIFIIRTVQRNVFNHTFGYVCADMETLMALKTFEWDFITIPLKKEDKPALEAFTDTYDGRVFEAVDDVLELGYKVSVSWVETHNSYCCTVSGNEKTPTNNKRSITSWSDNLIESYAMMAYKVLEITKRGDWEEFAREDSNWG